MSFVNKPKRLVEAPLAPFFAAFVAAALPATTALGQVAENTVAVTTPDGADKDPSNNTAADRDEILRLLTSKIGRSVSGPDAGGVFTARYSIEISNDATANAVYGALIDTVDFPDNVEVISASWTCSGTSLSCVATGANGAGPYALSSAGTPILAQTVHTYEIAVLFRYEDDIQPAGCAAGEGLSNTIALPEGQGVASPTNTACLAPPPLPSTLLQLIKAAGVPTGNMAGASLPYSFNVFNAGDITLNNLVVNDDILDGPAVCDVVTLPPKGTTVCVGVRTLTQADFDAGVADNTATVTGITPGGSTITSNPSPTTVPLIQNPSLTLAKGVTEPTVYAVGTLVPYNFTVVNTGNVTLDSLVITDDKLDAAVTCPVTTLAPASTTTCTGLYTLTQQDLDNGSVVNTATAGGTSPSGTPAVSTPSTVTINMVQTPQLTLVKTAGDTTGLTIGSPLEYQFAVTNTGNVTLENVLIEDIRLDAPATCQVYTLASGESTTCVGLRTLTVEDFSVANADNTAVARGNTPSGGDQSSPPSMVNVPLIQTASMTLDKVAIQTTYQWAGDVVSYEYRLTNTGNVAINDLAITDDRISNVLCPQTKLNVLQSVTCTADYTVTQQDLELGFITNIATATGNTVIGPLPPVTDTETIEATITPAIALEKSATLTRDTRVIGKGDANDEISYAVVVTNTGNVSIGDLVVEDVYQGGASTLLNCAPLVLAPGQQSICDGYTHVITSAEANAGGTLENIASVVGTPSRGGGNLTANDDATIELADPTTTLRLVKQAAPRDVKVGDIVRYSVSVENIGQSDAVDVTVFDTPPAGFTLIENSLSVIDGDNQGRLSGIRPFRVDQLDISAGERASINYLLRVGAGVRPGVHINEAYAQDRDYTSNTAKAEVRLIGDPLLEDSLVIGTVYDDRDADGWQDTAHLDQIRVSGGLTSNVLIGTALIDGQSVETSLGDGLNLVHIPARQSIAEDAPKVVISQHVTEPSFDDSFTLTTRQGISLRMDAAGELATELSGDAERGLTAASPTVERRISATNVGYRVDYVISNEGIDERGIAGVRIASVEGLLIETDQFGRYHLEGVQGGEWERGRNFILSVDDASLPKGSVFTTDNPNLRRITPGLPVRFDFGVQLPVEIIGGGTEEVVLKLAEIMFAPASAEVRDIYAPILDHLATEVKARGKGDIVITANGETHSLAYDRAVSVRQAMETRLSAAELAQLTVTVQTDREDNQNWVARITDAPVLGEVLFDTDKWAIRPEFEPLLDRVAQTLEAAHAETGSEMLIRLVGHTDLRMSDEYNLRLGLRRSQSVFEALAYRMSPSFRSKLRVEITSNPSATTSKPTDK